MIRGRRRPLPSLVRWRAFLAELHGKMPARRGWRLPRALGEEGEILTLGVIPDRRRSGVGSALLAAIVAEARGQGLRALFLEVAQDNSAARALYAAHGFVQIGRRANYYRRPSGLADALVLRHLLST